MRTEIRNISIKLGRLIAVYGFGSAFRSESFADVDILAIFDSDSSESFVDYLEFVKAVKNLQSHLGTKIDITALTISEAARKPLRESNELIPLYKRDRRALHSRRKRRAVKS